MVTAERPAQVATLKGNPTHEEVLAVKSMRRVVSVSLHHKDEP